MQPATKSVLVYDYTLRIFHWTFAASLTGALGLALLGDEHGRLFAWHMLLGIIAVLMLLLRLVLGFVGSKYARFSRMPVRPSQIIAHLRGLFEGGAKRYAGHNPGSAFAALAMFLTVPLLLATGLVAGREPWEDVHGFLGYALLSLIGLHLAGLAWHTVQHRENIALAMISGRKIGLPDEAITSAHPGWAVACVIGVSAWIGGLLANHDAVGAKVRLPLTGLTIELGKNEGGEPKREKEKRKHRDGHER